MTDEIFGYFDKHGYKSAIEIIAQRLPNNCTIVELGTFFGRATVAWAEVMRGLNKKCKIYSLDVFDYTPTKLFTVGPKQLIGIKSIWPFVLGECSHLEMVQTLVEPYPEIKLIVSDFHKDPLPVDTIDCIYYDGFHEIDISDCIDRWATTLNSNGIISGQNCGVHGLYEAAESKNMTVVRPNPDSIVFYLEKNQ